MKKPVRQSICLFIFIAGAVLQHVSAQSIAGDTVFVNAEAEVQIKFPSKPSDFYTTPNNAPYNLKSLSAGFTISAKSENTKPAFLFVTEGGRTHHFVMAFKKDINYDNEAELYFDYSTKKKLEQHIEQMAARKAVIAAIAPVTAPAPAETTTNEKKPQKNIVTPADKNTGTPSYYALLEEGDKNMKLGLYKEAKSNYEAAHNLRPEDRIPIMRLEEIKAKTTDQNKNADLEKNKKYTTLTGEAKALFDLKKYAESKDVYQKALALRPGDLYATNQLEKIDKILNEQKGQLEQKRLHDLYSNYMIEGDKALTKSQLTDARIAFEQALIIKQNDPAASSKLKIINEKEKREKESHEIENNYNEAIQAADKFYQLGDYSNAKLAYTKALGFSKRPWPMDQIKEINKKMADLAAKEIADKQLQARQAETEKKEREKQELENKYYAAVQEADRLFKAEDYTNAKIEYSNALRISNRPWPNEQIVEINKRIQDLAKQAITEKQKQAKQAEIERREKESLELENKYSIAIAAADNFYKAGDLKNAKSGYIKAREIFKRPWPDEQISTINKKVEEQAAAEVAEKARLAKEARISTQYAANIQKADVEFDKSNYIIARKFYSDALVLKPSETHPQERLQSIQTALDLIAKVKKERADSIAAAVELKKKYDLALSKGKAYFSKEDFINAQIAYKEAILLNPDETEPQIQLTNTNKKLEEIALTNKYESIIARGDSLMILKENEKAIAAFTEASALKPSESYPKKQLKAINADIAYTNRENFVRAYNDSIKKVNDEIDRFNTAIRNAENAKAERRFRDAKNAYTEALSIRPDNEGVQRGLKIIQYQLDKEAGKPAEEKTVVAKAAESPAKPEKKPAAEEIKKPAEPEKQNNGQPVVHQINPNPYTPAELKTKYPGIDFSNLPPQQPHFDEAVNTTEIQQNFKEVLLENPRLDISGTDHSVKMICQGITFIDKSSYLKILVQNNSKEDFLTGAMMLTWNRKLRNGAETRIKLFPLYIYPAFLPIVKPGSEAVVIYVCKTYNITEKEKLEFELMDRLEKITLKINFTGEVYNREFSR